MQTRGVKVNKALDFIRRHGIVLVSASGPVPNLASYIAGETIKGSWWGHSKGQEIFAVLESVTDSPDILVCRLVNGKVTLVHKRIWPSLVRLAEKFSPKQLVQVHQEHTASGRHINYDVPYPKWVPAEVKKQARRLSESDAANSLGALAAMLPNIALLPTRAKGKRS
jgi:hypothetical protein